MRPDKSDWHIKHVCISGASAATTSTSQSTTSGAQVEGITASLPVQCGGLEVFCRQTGKWIQVCIPTHLNALVVNAGIFHFFDSFIVS